MVFKNRLKESSLWKLGNQGSQYLYNDYLGSVVGANTEKRIIALTFDDGPTPATTRILDVLEFYEVKATFFLLGQHVTAHPEIAQDVVARGHAIGNHTFTHPHLSRLTPFKVRQELQRCQQAIQAATGQNPMIMRPPYGSQHPNTVFTSRMMGHIVVNWSVAGDDWMGDPATLIAERVLAKCRPGSIILLHDGCVPNPDSPLSREQQALVADRTPTIDSLPIIIRHLLHQGYHFVTVPELLQSQPVLKEGWFW